MGVGGWISSLQKELGIYGKINGYFRYFLKMDLAKKKRKQMQPTHVRNGKLQYIQCLFLDLDILYVSFSLYACAGVCSLHCAHSLDVFLLP